MHLWRVGARFDVCSRQVAVNQEVNIHLVCKLVFQVQDSCEFVYIAITISSHGLLLLLESADAGF